MRVTALIGSLFCACVPSGGFDAGLGGDGGTPLVTPDASFPDGSTPDAGGWTVARFAGNGAPGAVDGPADTARFNAPTALAIDTAGTLYVADTGNRAVRKVYVNGNVTTLYTRRTPAFLGPQGVALDNSGNVFVADTLDHCVYRVDSQGNLVEFAGSCTLGDAGFTRCGDAPPGSFGGPTAASIGSPMGLAVDADAGILYIADAYHELVRFRPLNGNVVGSVAGRGSTFAFSDGECGQNFCCGYQYDISGCRLPQFSAFRAPTGLGLSPNGDLFVADQENCAIRKVTAPTGAACRVSTVAGNPTCGAGAQSLNGPAGVAVGPDGAVYASDTNNQRVVLIDLTRPLSSRVVAVAGGGQLFNPWGIAVDARGRVFVVDTGNNMIRVLTPP